MVGLLHFHLQTGSLYSGIPTKVDETVIPPWHGPQSLVCKSGLHQAYEDEIWLGEVTDYVLPLTAYLIMKHQPRGKWRKGQSLKRILDC